MPIRSSHVGGGNGGGFDGSGGGDGGDGEGGGVGGGGRGGGLGSGDGGFGSGGGTGGVGGDGGGERGDISNVPPNADMPAWYGTLVARRRVPSLINATSPSPIGKCSSPTGGRKYVMYSELDVSQVCAHGIDGSRVATPPVYEQTSSP